MRQLVIAIALSAELSVARAQGPSKSPSEAPTPAAQPKVAAPAAPPEAAAPTATKPSAAPIDAEAEHMASVQLATARAYLVQEDLPAAAIEPLTNFLGVHPHHFQARLMRAYAHGRVGHYVESQADYQEALNVMTGTSADEVLARAQEFSFTKQREIALTLIEDGIRRLGPMPNLEAAALKLELALHRTDEAVARIKGMLSRTKRKEKLYAKLGDILDEAGHPDEAWDARRQAVAAIDELPESQQVGKVKRLRDDLVYRLNRAGKNSSW